MHGDFPIAALRGVKTQPKFANEEVENAQSVRPEEQAAPNSESSTLCDEAAGAITIIAKNVQSLQAADREEELLAELQTIT